MSTENRDADAETDTPPETEGLHRIGPAEEINEGERVIADVRGREIAVFNLDGEYHALSNYCTHQGGPACEGLLTGTVDVDENAELCWARDDEIVSCPWHGWEFDVTDGSHLGSDRYRLPTYDVRVVEGDLYVDL
jgi:nitrite reductase/ring-hydroxylating ferredoxin subunit